MSIKILMLCDASLRPDGLTLYSFIDEEIVALRKRGFEIVIPSYSHAEDCVIEGIQIRSLQSASRWRGRLDALRVLPRFRHYLKGIGWRRAKDLLYFLRIEVQAASLALSDGVDIIHSHFAYPGGLGGLPASILSGKPLVATFRGCDLVSDVPWEKNVYLGWRSDPLFASGLSALLSGANRTLYVSDYMRHEGLALGARPELASTVHKGVDIDKFVPITDSKAFRQSLGIRGAMILAVCGLLPEKGLQYILPGLGELASQHEFTLVVCGVGPQLPELELMTRQLGLEGRVLFRGKVSREEIPRYFAAADMFVLGSVTEASGNVLLEASASGCPAIATDSGGPPEYVHHGVTGLIVPPVSISAMRDAIEQLLVETDFRKRLGVQARSLMETTFPYDAMIDKIAHAYHDVSGQHPPVAGAATSEIVEPRRFS